MSIKQNESLDPVLGEDTVMPSILNVIQDRDSPWLFILLLKRFFWSFVKSVL